MKRRTVMIGTVLLWALGCLGHYYFWTVAILRGPREIDLYAFSWGFQALNFALFPFPLWLMILGIVIYYERDYFNKKGKETHPEQTAPADRG